MIDTPEFLDDDEFFPAELVREVPDFLVACMNLFRASELWGARMGTFLAQALPTAELRADALAHTAEEIEHTRAFDRRIRDLGGVPGPVPAEAIYLVCCARSGATLSESRVEGAVVPALSRQECVLLFAGLQLIESRGVYSLTRFASALPEGDRSRGVFEALVQDEAEHASRGRDHLQALCCESPAKLRAALDNAREAERVAWRTFIENARNYSMSFLGDSTAIPRVASEASGATGEGSAEAAPQNMNARDLIFRMPERVDAEEARGVFGTILFNLRGQGGGRFSVTLAEATVEVSEEEAGSPTTTLDLDADDFVQMALGGVSGRDLFLAGRMQVGGSSGLAMKLGKLFKPAN